MSKFNEKIKSTFQTPPPERKDEFIRKYRNEWGVTDISPLQLILSQAAYIQKPVWIISVLVFIISILQIHAQGLETLTLVAMLMPFVSVVAVIDSFRSHRYKMGELENVTRFSVRGILFAKISAIGASHIILILAATIALGRHGEFGYLLTGAFIIIPYLLSSVISMEMERTALGRKNAFLCVGVSAFVSSAVFIAHSYSDIIIQTTPGIWMICTAILIAAEMIEFKKMFRMEAYAWN